MPGPVAVAQQDPAGPLVVEWIDGAAGRQPHLDIGTLAIEAREPTVFWGPMAHAVMGGLVVATLLALVFLPALYVAWFRIKPQDAS
jgi:hypothetical protein